MAKGIREKAGPWTKGCSFSGRTIGKMFSKKKNSGSEHLQLRSKTDLRPRGRNRFPLGKFRLADPTGKLTWEELNSQK